MKDPEPWFLLTNLPEGITRTMVLNRYAECFETEEAFKDVKRLEAASMATGQKSRGYP